MHTYIVVNGIISLTGTDNANRRNKSPTFKNNALFRSCISKINNTLIANAEDIDIVMPMYNLLALKIILLLQDVRRVIIEMA